VTLGAPVSYTAATGNFLTAALWNAQVRDANTFFSAPPSFRAYATVAQSILDNTWVSLNLDTEQFDNYGGHSTSTNTSRYTCQVAGIYQVTGIASYASNGTGNRAVRLTLNGNAVAGSFVKVPAAIPSASAAVHTSALVALAVGDYIEVQANQNSGTASPGLSTSVGGPDVYPSLSALWVSN